MMDLYFFFKTLILTIALVVVLQIKIGDQTIENQAVSLFRSSGMEAPLLDIAQGGASLARGAISYVQEKVNGKSEKAKDKSATEKKSGFRFNWDSQ